MTKITINIDPDLQDFIPGYLENRAKDLDTFTQLLAAQNFAEIQRLGHKISGSAGGYGFDQLSVITKKIENAAKVQQADIILTGIKEIQEYLSSLQLNYSK